MKHRHYEPFKKICGLTPRTNRRTTVNEYVDNLLDYCSQANFILRRLTICHDTWQNVPLYVALEMLGADRGIMLPWGHSKLEAAYDSTLARSVLGEIDIGMLSNVLLLLTAVVDLQGPSPLRKYLYINLNKKEK